MSAQDRLHCDVLVIGSGAAGLTLALEASKWADVIVVSKRAASEANTKYAQGGISAVLAPDDSFDEHVKDTLIAGAGLCKEPVVRAIVEGAPARIKALQDLGVEFDMRPKGDGSQFESGELDLGREGGHSKRRVAHSGDITGRSVEAALLAACQASPRIRILEDHMAIDLIVPARFGGNDRCVGAYVLDCATSPEPGTPEADARTARVLTVTAHATVLATGGAGKVYLYTSNPDVASGDGVAMAYRAGAVIANMEFFQFHPTCLYHPQAKSFLISEALRGEGAILRTIDGTPFMKKYDPRADLAPRDIVARSIDAEMKRTGAEHVLLDITSQRPEFTKARFPNIYAECLRWGFDLTAQPIPVVPAAHYMCGGVAADVDGRTSVSWLYAIGEVSCTGLHGANRLASNSLLEGLVMGYRCAKLLEEKMGDRSQRPAIPEVPSWDAGAAAPSDEAVVVTQNWDELRRAMWNYVGIVRSQKRLARALHRINMLQEEIREYYWAHLVTRDLLELRNLATVAELIVKCAMARRESRGLHTMLDAPNTDPRMQRDTILRRGTLATLDGV
ncbi:MAG: L-aspartate oxidase [Deltaproteobacteria bacterium]|nr:L-aspartate oxidase [Deltaproteobacteria bacterium]